MDQQDDVAEISLTTPVGRLAALARPVDDTERASLLENLRRSEH